jgi:hypothetical protein
MNQHRLLPHHAEMLSQKGIPPEIARERGYRSVSDMALLAELGFSVTADQVPGLLVPLYDVTGAFRHCIYMPDNGEE